MKFVFGFISAVVIALMMLAAYNLGKIAGAKDATIFKQEGGCVTTYPNPKSEAIEKCRNVADGIFELDGKFGCIYLDDSNKDMIDKTWSDYLDRNMKIKKGTWRQ